MAVCRQLLTERFLSTPSARRATIIWDNFKRFMGISIHALREEGDEMPSKMFSFSFSFLSTPSARRATIALCYLVFSLGISIHALREEGDA